MTLYYIHFEKPDINGSEDVFLEKILLQGIANYSFQKTGTHFKNMYIKKKATLLLLWKLPC